MASGPANPRTVRSNTAGSAAEPSSQRTIEAFASHPAIGSIVVAIHPDDGELLSRKRTVQPTRSSSCRAGATRQESTRLALSALAAENPGIVLIHDAVRPFVDAALIDRVVASVGEGHGALPALPVSDTLKRAAADATDPRNGSPR